ncbi:MAG: hypothetical protein U9N34_02905 [Candidatus Cloacimonadota bacterium]|nr:hypothetical protein [Candidatus Cloacimonadota bacterium]
MVIDYTNIQKVIFSFVLFLVSEKRHFCSRMRKRLVEKLTHTLKLSEDSHFSEVPLDCIDCVNALLPHPGETKDK